MKRVIHIAGPIGLLLVFLSPVFFLGDHRSELVQPKVILESFHDRYVTALGGEGWWLKQEPDLSDCGGFTLRYLDNGKVALVTCYDRYVTAPKTGTRSDWRLWQESELGDCGQFVLHNLGRDGFAFETCAGHFLTAGDGGWPGELAWAIVGETDTIGGWERFKLQRPYTPSQSVITNFDSCGDPKKRGRKMEPIHDPSAGNTLDVSYVQEAGHGCVARLAYDIADWSAFWIDLLGADLRPYSQLVFDIRADPQNAPPDRIKIELKRAEGREVSILDISGITTDWQTMRVNLSDFEPTDYMGPLSSFADMEELLFTFDVERSGTTGIVYLDNIALQ
jgi:hypothetical protein